MIVLYIVTALSLTTTFVDGFFTRHKHPVDAGMKKRVKPAFGGCIMTRDDVCLHSEIYIPSSTNDEDTFDIVYRKTPYNYGDMVSDIDTWTALGYGFIAQDCRGRHESNGSYAFFRTEGNDTIDTIKWCVNSKVNKKLLENWSGYFASTGMSADSLSQYSNPIGVTLGGNFSADDITLNRWRVAYLKCGDGLGRQTAFQGGAYRQGLITGYLNLLGEHSTIKDILDNEAWDSYWYQLAGNWTGWDPEDHPNESQLSIANLSIIHHAGWYDIFSTPQILTALAVNETSQENAKGNQILIISPGGHCEGGDIWWPNRTYSEDEMDKYLPIIFKNAFEAAKNNELFNIHDSIPYNVLYYMLGPGDKGGKDQVGNYWVKSMALPQYEEVVYYLDGTNGNDNGYLSLMDLNAIEDGENTYEFDPKDPVRTHGGNNLVLQPCGPCSQEDNEKDRKDIIHYSSEVLNETIGIVGMIYVKLYVSSDCVDTDFTAKLIDIFPDGTPMLVQDSIVRMRWLNGEYATSNEQFSMKSGTIYQIQIDIGYMAYVFNKGHQISLSISSSNYKRFSINYNNGNWVKDGDTDYKIANNVVHFGPSNPSMLVLPMVDLDEVNKDKVEM